MNIKKALKKDFKSALKKIKEYDKIVVFRHQRPDFDAMGTQLGLVYWLRDSFPTKEVHFVGKDFSQFKDTLYPAMEMVDDSFFENKFLAIIVDTGNSQRIDDEK